jgi:hypothetical protein
MIRMRRLRRPAPRATGPRLPSFEVGEVSLELQIEVHGRLFLRGVAIGAIGDAEVRPRQSAHTRPRSTSKAGSVSGATGRTAAGTPGTAPPSQRAGSVFSPCSVYPQQCYSEHRSRPPARVPVDRTRSRTVPGRNECARPRQARAGDAIVETPWRQGRPGRVWLGRRLRILTARCECGLRQRQTVVLTP